MRAISIRPLSAASLVVTLLATGLLCLAAALSANARTFTDHAGGQIEADLVEVSDQTVTIMRKGKHYTIPMVKFSPQDQAYFRSWLAADGGIKGIIRADVDDTGKFWLNGELIFHVQTWGRQHESNETTLKDGDSLVIDVRNIWSDGFFRMVFVEAETGRQVFFKATDFVLIEDEAVTMITRSEFDDLEERPTVHRQMQEQAAPELKESDWIWGKDQRFRIGIVLTKDLLGRTAEPN